jgi:hypothetical protein
MVRFDTVVYAHIIVNDDLILNMLRLFNVAEKSLYTYKCLCNIKCW